VEHNFAILILCLTNFVTQSAVKLTALAMSNSSPRWGLPLEDY